MTKRHLLLALSLAAAAPAAALTWHPVDGPDPPPRRNAAAVHDPLAQRLVLFGGRGPDGDLADLWAFDLASDRWQEITPRQGPSPPARFTHNAVYDPAGHRMLVWSGRIVNAQGSTLLNDVWALDLSTDRWQELVATTQAPNRRYGTGAVFDPVAGELVTFAGFTTLGRFDDTWRFAPDTGTWREVTAASAQPGKRCLHAAAYDGRRRRMLIFGGQRGNASLDDAWALELATDRWVQLASAPQTGGRRFAAAAWDPARDWLLVFGGEATDGSRGGDLWALDLRADRWSRLTNSGPPARDGAVMVRVPALDTAGAGRLLLFGGTTEGGTVGDTWTLELPPVATAVTGPRGSAHQGDIGPPAQLTAFPNPFNTTVVLQVHTAVPQRLQIRDLLGRPVRDLGLLAPGARVTWDGLDGQGRGAAGGLYLAVLTPAVSAARGQVVTRIVLLR